MRIIIQCVRNASVTIGGDFYPALIAIANAVIIYQILRVMYRQQVFLKV